MSFTTPPRLKSAWVSLTSPVAMRNPGLASLLGAFVLATAFVVTVCYFCPPIWATNDDVQMSMAAHGYGFAVYGSPNIVFSNVIWGYLVRALPTVANTLGYSEASLAALLTVSIAVIYALWRAGASPLTCFLALVLALFPALIRPQFTVNAGLLGVSAVLCMVVYANSASRSILIAACALAFCGYLVRDLECVMVMGIALPLLPLREIMRDRIARRIVAAFFVAIAIAAVVDHDAYQTPEWQAYTSLNAARRPIIDYGTGALLEQRPDILNRHGYTPGDIELIGDWFSGDPKVANPEALQAMDRELGWQVLSHPIPNILDALWSLLVDPTTLSLLLVALVLALLYPSWRLFMAWGLFLVAISLTGLLHRPGMLRVEVPPILLLLMVPLVSRRPVDWRRFVEMAVLLCCASFAAFASLKEWRQMHRNALFIQEEVADFPSYPVVAWGGAFPYPPLYFVLDSADVRYKLYMMDAFTIAPYSLSYADDKSGFGFTKRLVGKTGLPFVLNERFREGLEYYCEAHLHGSLQEISVQDLRVMKINRYRCVTEN